MVTAAVANYKIWIIFNHAQPLSHQFEGEA